MSTDPDSRLIKDPEHLASDKRQTTKYPTGVGTPYGNEVAKDPMAEEYLDILLRARNG